MPSLHLLPLHESTGVKVKDYLSGWKHPDEQVRNLSETWDSRDECGICFGPLAQPSLLYPGEPEDVEATEVEALVENPSCKHVFHRTCIQQSVIAGVLYCPLCKSVIKQPVLNDLAPGMGYIELASSDQQAAQRGYDGFYDEARNEAMRAQNVDPADEVDNMASGELEMELRKLETTASTLSKLPSPPPSLQYGLESVVDLLKISSMATGRGTLTFEKLELWHHASALLTTYNQVHLWPFQTRNRDAKNRRWFSFFDDAMLFLRMDLAQLRKILIYTGPSNDTEMFKMGEKELTGLPGLDGAIDLVWDNKRSSMVANDPFLSDEQTLALRHYIHDAMELPEISREGPDLYIELSGVSDILGGLEIFLPGLEKEMVETIQKTIEQVLSELVQRFPEAAPLVQVSAWRAVSPSSTN